MITLRIFEFEVLVSIYSAGHASSGISFLKLNCITYLVVAKTNG